MKKKDRDKRLTSGWFFLLIVLLALGASTSCATAAPRYIDEVGLLSPTQNLELRQRLDQVSEAHRFDVVVAVVRDLDYRAAHLYAADLFEDRGFGYGPGEDGAILLLAMAERDFGFAALGSGIGAFTPAGQEYLDKLFLPDLREDHYFEGFLAFANAVDDFLVMADGGTPYDSGNIPLLASERRAYQLIAVGASLFIALLAALITAQIAKSQLKSIRQQQYAHDYMRKDSLVVATSRDIFLYRNVTRQKKEQNKKGGGSFTTSSGRKATGHSGKF
ncbi:MAG: TPM domain-containing protein [Limnochordia bacterium]|nr:TPM domain-containing protein [Limnochordia bacterium]